jgi:hypothetical protein
MEKTSLGQIFLNFNIPTIHILPPFVWEMTVCRIKTTFPRNILSFHSKNKRELLKISDWKNKLLKHCFLLGAAVARWLRCCATNRKIAGSIPGGVFGNFH